MRKWIVRLLILVLCLSLVPSVLARSEGTEAAPELTAFTLENAEKVIAYYGWEGITGTVDNGTFTFWRPDTMARMAIPAELEEEGYLDAFAAADCTIAVIAQDYGISLEKYEAAVQKNGCKNVRHEDINGIDFLVYDEPQGDGSLCRVAAVGQEKGMILEFVLFYENEQQDAQINAILASVRPTEDDQSEQK